MNGIIRNVSRWIIWFVIPVIGLVMAGRAQASAVSYHIPKVDHEITVDARLDEPFWAEALTIDANVEVRPAENVPAPVETRAYLAYTETRIYGAIIAYDPEPAKIRAHVCDRDAMYNDDWVLVLFDTFNDQRRSYDFFMNPLGIQGDEIEVANGNNSQWDAIWDSAGRITNEGYIVEFSIPFSAINFQETDGDQVWSFDVVRSYPRKVRHHIGAFPRDRNNNCYLCQAPKLVGFAGVKPGKNVEANPTFSMGHTENREEIDGGGYGSFSGEDTRYDPGVTASWGVTNNMTLVATVNPDFSQIEADVAQMDINTRFPLYYSEKRPFFMEGADFYKVGDLVHTRTLANPDWGIKLTGKSGKNSIGLFTVRDTVTPLVFSGPEGADTTTMSKQSQGTVVRFRRDILSSSTMGVLLTDREGDGYHNRLLSADANIKFTKKDNLSIQAAYSGTLYPDAVAAEYDQKKGAFGGAGYEISYNHTTEFWNVYGVVRETTPELRADLGYINKVGERYNEFGGEYRWRADGDNWYNWLSIYASHDYSRDYRFNPLHRVVSARVNYEGPRQSSFGMYGEYGHDWYEGKKYGADMLNYWFNIDVTPSTRSGFSGAFGERIDYTNERGGRLVGFSPFVNQRIGNRLKVYLSHDYQRLNVGGTPLYTGNVTNTETEYNFTRRAFIRVILQHVHYDREVMRYLPDERGEVDPLSKNIFTQVLFSYTINPRTVFYLGYSDTYRNRTYDDDTQGRRYSDESFIQTNRALFTKIAYAWQI